MWLVRVIILATGSPNQELSYFSAEEMPLGSIIRVPLRGKEGFGLVIEARPAGDMKQELRASPFPLRKLTNPAPAHVLRRAYLRALFEASQYEACPPGALIAAYVPAAIVKRRGSLPVAIDETESREVSYEPLVFAQARLERIAEYKRLAREGLARGNSMLIIAPTIAEVLSLKAALERGIEGYVETLHSGLSEKKLVDAWTRISNSAHALLIIGTPQALACPRTDIRTIVLEREGSRAYDREEYPYASGARVAESVARAIGARYILAGTVLSVVSAARKMQGEVGDYGISATRIMGVAPTVLDLRTQPKIKGSWSPITPEALEQITKLRAQKQSVLVLCARRGLSPMTVCDDCGTTLTCKTCGSYLVLHAKENERQFVCHHCTTTESASVRCRHCDGWRLTTLGIAIDRVAEALSSALPTEKLMVLSPDRLTPAQLVKTMERFREQGGLLVATELVLPYLPDRLAGVVVASIDAFLSIPEYSASERAFTLLCELKTRAEHLFFIQTRSPEHRAIRAVLEGMASTFYKDELADRKTYHYPPHTTLVRLTVTGKPVPTNAEAHKIQKALTHLSPVLYEGRMGRRGLARVHVLVRLPAESWIDQRLLRFIRTLPPSTSVRINPRTLTTD